MSDIPFVFMRTGFPHSAPEGFYEQVVADYDAVEVSSDEVFCRNLQAKGLEGSLLDEANRRHLAYRLADILSIGRNVLCNPYLNRHAERQQVRTLAQTQSELGAHAVILSVNAPLDIVNRRILKSYSQQDGTIPSEFKRAIAADMQRARTAKELVEWPTKRQRHLRLDGSLASDTLMARVHEYTEAKRQRVAK